MDLVNDYIAAGVPVFTYNTDIEASNRFAFFALQEVAAASINGRVTAELVQAQGLDVNQVAMGSGLPNDQWARQRMEGFTKGFTEVFGDADFFNDVDSGLPTGENFTTQEVLDSVGPFMLANPDVNLFFHTDQGVEGVGQVIQNQGRVGQAWTSGFNVSDPILDLIDAGAILVTVDQGFDNQSELATTACVDLLADGATARQRTPRPQPHRHHQRRRRGTRVHRRRPRPLRRTRLSIRSVASGDEETPAVTTHRAGPDPRARSARSAAG